jgi:hypothetical protein
MARKIRLAPLDASLPTVFREVNCVAFSTIPLGDFHAFQLPNDMVQPEPATTLDPELMVPLAAIGIVKDKPWAPDERMKKIMTEVADGSTMLWFAATSPRVWRSATGSRPSPARANSLRCGCTARSNRSLPGSAGRARSNRFGDLPVARRSR